MCGWNQGRLKRKEVVLHTLTQLSARTNPAVSLKGRLEWGFTVGGTMCFGSEIFLGSKVKMRPSGRSLIQHRLHSNEKKRVGREEMHAQEGDT